MTNQGYAIKVNRRDGAVEVVGDDKDWVAAQFDKLTSVLSTDGDWEDTRADQDEGETPPKSSTRKRARGQTSSRKQAVPTQVPEKLTSDAQGKLTQFVTERAAHFKKAQEQVAIIAAFLEDELGFDGIDQDDVKAVFDIMGWRQPGNARSAINNARERNKFFQGWSGGRARLSATGKNFGRIDSKGAAES